jgi:hypothetical protein
MAVDREYEMTGNQDLPPDRAGAGGGGEEHINDAALEVGSHTAGSMR